MAWIHIIGPGWQGSRFELDSDLLEIGSAPSCQVVLKGAEIPPVACRLERIGRGFVPRLVGRAGQAALVDGDRFGVAGLEVVFCDPGAGRKPLPPPPFGTGVALPDLSLIRRFAWPLSAAGRLWHGLKKALEAPRETAALTALEKLCARLPAADFSGDEQTANVFRVALEHLAGVAVASGAREAAQDRLAQLDSAFPQSTVRSALRWELMRGLWDSGVFAAFVDQARPLLSSSVPAQPQWEPVLRSAIGAVWTCKSAAVAHELMLASQQKVKALPVVRNLLDLAAAVGGHTVDRHVAVARKIQSSDGTFAPAIIADACLVLARAAEQSGDAAAMLRHCLDALRAAPSHFEALYWLTRARLYDLNTRPADHLGPQFHAESEEWRRLLYLVDLHQHPTIATACRMAAFLKSAKADGPEVRLMASLAGRALRGLEPEQSEIDGLGTVCELLQQAAGPLPWAEVHVARKSIVVDRRYQTAIDKLRTKHVALQPGAQELEAVARVLAGQPAPSKPEVPMLLGQALEALARPPAGKVSPVQLPAAESPEFARYPALSTCLNALAQASAAVQGKTLPPSEPGSSQTAVQWASWLRARAVELAFGFDADRALELDLREPAVAWVVAQAMANSSGPASISQSVQPKIEPTIRQWLEEVPKGLRERLRWVQEARRLRYNLAEPAPAFSTVEFFPELGPLCSAASLADLDFEVGFAQARALLANGKLADALAALARAETRSSELPTLIASWWRPLTRYWLAVALAHKGEAAAADGFRALLGGPQDAAARAQLALLHLQRGETEAAGELLSSRSLEMPAWRYAKALLWSRTGEQGRALAELESASEVMLGTRYAAPAARLKAALLERGGDIGRCVAVLDEIMVSNPSDAVAAARAARVGLRREYDRLRETGAEALPPPPNRTAAQPIAWAKPYLLIACALAAAPADHAGMAEAFAAGGRDTRRPAAWARLHARLLLSGGAVSEAAAVIRDSEHSDGSPAGRRAAAILGIWRELSAASLEAPAPGGLHDILAKRVAELEAAERDGDELAVRWRGFGAKALALCDEADSQGTWFEPELHPIRLIPGICSADATERTQAAAALRSTLSGDERCWPVAEAHLLVEALCAWELRDDDRFLDLYGQLERALDRLPVPGPALWVASGWIHFQRGDWPHLLESELPECVAELEDRDARALIALAYGRAAVEDYVRNNNVRAALQKLRQALDNLDILHSGTGTGVREEETQRKHATR